MRVQNEKNRESRELILQGIGVSPGVAWGPVYLLTSAFPCIEERDIADHEIRDELQRFETALEATRQQLRDIQQTLQASAGTGDALILDVHLMVLDDTAFVDEVVRNVHGLRRNIEYVVKHAADSYASALEAVQDAYLRERVADVRDVARRLIRNLAHPHRDVGGGLPEGHVLIADELAPSDTAALAGQRIVAFATDLGSATSHTAVVARMLDIPAVVGLRDAAERIASGDTVLVDGNKGVLIVRPSPERLEQYGRLAETRRTIVRKLDALQAEPAETRDGHRIALSANIEGQGEVPCVAHYGAHGVGLFRTEFAFFARERMLDEREQTELYTAVASELAPAPVVIRTLDIGGDKFLPQARRHPEPNPFLGCRSIRLSLKHPEAFKVQLRAILRASVTGNVRIMFPMISRLAELEQARGCLDEARQELATEGVAFDARMPVGIMIETPAAALTADSLATHADFFSIGTNDLIQYTIAVDRGNEQVADLYEPTHPAVLRLIDRTVKAAHARRLPVAVCGQMAADPVMAPLLLGLGVDELSMSPRVIPLVKQMVRSVTRAESRTLAKRALLCDCSQDVLERCRALTRKTAPELLELV